MEAEIVYLESIHQGEALYSMGDAIAIRASLGNKNSEICGDLSEIALE